MDSSKLSTQLRAGFFMALGLLCIGALVIYFGRFGESVKRFYIITVEYRNASGLLKGADVMLSGAKIGEVATAPKVLANMRGVAVPLKIEESVQIPEGSVFSIGSSGLLGDRFVTVTMNGNSTDMKALPPGSVITNGLSESSIAELQRQIHDEILPKLGSALDNIDAVSQSLRKDIFNPQGVKNLQVTLANLKIASDGFAAGSAQIKTVADQATIFLKKGNATMDSAKGAAVDLKAFIANLRQHGVLFYRDTAATEESGPLRKKP